MSMTFSTARPFVVCCVLSFALVGCNAGDVSEPSAETPASSGSTSAEQSARAEALTEIASSASQQAEEMPTVLLVVNKTPGTVLLTNADGQSTATIDPGKQLKLASKRVCDWLPLIASTADGRVIEEYTQPCQGQTWTIAPSEDPTQRPQLVQDEEAPVAADLHRLAEMFVRYAIGNARGFPHWESVSMAIGGRAVLSIDDISAALSNREIWKICPADWDSYGAASCPVNFLSPITNTAKNDAPIVYSADYEDVTCAPARSGSLPPGRLVVLRPSEDWRTCASDFALVLGSDSHGRLRSIDLTLSEP